MSIFVMQERHGFVGYAEVEEGEIKSSLRDYGGNDLAHVSDSFAVVR